MFVRGPACFVITDCLLIVTRVTLRRLHQQAGRPRAGAARIWPRAIDGGRDLVRQCVDEVCAVYSEGVQEVLHCLDGSAVAI